MTEIEISLTAKAKLASIPATVERAASTQNLTLTLKGTLAKYAGCVHWHYKKGKEPGTLEITWWPREKRLWLKVAANRRATWIDEIILTSSNQSKQSCEIIAETSAVSAPAGG